jgi:hypothetical protein
MYALRSLVHTITCPLPPDAAFTKLLTALREQQVAIQHEYRDTGKIIVRCLSVFINLLLWRCWSDELVIEVKGEDESRTNVSFYAVPNLKRHKVRKDETLKDLAKLITQLESELHISF